MKTFKLYFINLSSCSHIDFDECADAATNDCNQTCTNNLGSYVCSCDDGYKLAIDKKGCNGMYCKCLCIFLFSTHFRERDIRLSITIVLFNGSQLAKMKM